MKDATHHIRHIQRKIIRLSRQEALQANSDHLNGTPNSNTSTAMLEPVESTGIKPLEKKNEYKSTRTKKKKIASYH